MSDLRFETAQSGAQLAAMSRINARGWRRAYADAVPADYMAEVITDGHWVPYYRADFAAGRAAGVLLCRGEEPVACATYGPARCGAAPGQSPDLVFSGGYEGWGEVISFYADPDETGRGYGALLMEEVLRRLREQGFSRCYVLVLRENAGARRFYERCGFRWDGTHEDIPFPHGVICTDLRYTRAL